MRIAKFVALSALLLASSSAVAKKPQVWPTGIFSNVHMSTVTGDLGGMEARFYEEASKHMVEFVWCEGWCNSTYKAELTRGDNAFMFQYIEVYEGGEGRIEADLHYVILPAGKNRIKIFAYQGRELLNEGKPQTLKRAKDLFGIDVANANVPEEN